MMALTGYGRFKSVQTNQSITRKDSSKRQCKLNSEFRLSVLQQQQQKEKEEKGEEEETGGKLKKQVLSFIIKTETPTCIVHGMT